MGAQWVHGEEDNSVYSLASAAGEVSPDIQTSEGSVHAENVVTAYSEDGKKITADQLKEYKEITKIIYDSTQRQLGQWDKSFGEYFVKMYVHVGYFTIGYAFS